MLKQLSIKNYALIKDLDLVFDGGLSVITGETGAGKSILLGALDLILGRRADTKVLFDPASKCIVEGTFRIGQYGLQSFFRDNDLDYDEQSIIRREITPQGKSRAFINDTPVNLAVLQGLGDALVDIHSQHQHLALADQDFQVFILDSYAGLRDEVADYRENYQRMLGLDRELQALIAQEEKSRTEKDYLEFLVEELGQARLKPGEQQELEEELKVLEHAEEIRTILFQTLQELDNERGGVLPDLGAILSGLNRISTFNPVLGEISRRFETLRIELQDLSREVERFEEQVTVDPARAGVVAGRLDTLYQLQQKHRVASVDALLEVMEQLNEKLNGIGNLESRIAALSKQLESMKADVADASGRISARRMEMAPRLEEEVLEAIRTLGLPNATFRAAMTSLAAPGRNGQDRLEFLFNANRGGEMRPLANVASGGEKSRLMLAIKSLISKKTLLPTIVFDEIDTGVSGAVADRVGEELQSLASAMQVIAVTHLPQIAGKGTHHYQVFKEVEDNITVTRIRKLDDEQRILEIAKLLSGRKVTSASVESARQLLNN